MTTLRIRRPRAVRYCCASLPLEVIKAMAAQADYRCWCARRDGVELLPSGQMFQMETLPVPRREES